MQFLLLTHIINNNIIHWNDINFNKPQYNPITSLNLVKFSWFADWVIGFTIA